MKNLQPNGGQFEKLNPTKELLSNVHTNLDTLTAHEHHSTNLRYAGAQIITSLVLRLSVIIYQSTLGSLLQV